LRTRTGSWRGTAFGGGTGMSEAVEAARIHR
jgi:hypothetical protein